MNKRAIFLDKDGTLIENVPYNVDPDKIHLTDRALPGLRRLKQAGYLLFIVTNQSGVALGLFGEQEVLRVETFLTNLLQKARIDLDGFYFCPHHPNGTISSYAISCDCRKPEPGLILQAARDHDIELSESWLIGDILNDIEAGNRAECRTILMDVNNETEWDLQPHRQPHYIVQNLDQAADVILMEADPKSIATPLKSLTRGQKLLANEDTVFVIQKNRK